jgi:hypothetical protein
MAAPEPQAAPEAPYTPVVTDLLRLIRAPFAPTGVFEELRAKPAFWLPWLVLSVVLVVLAVINLPFSEHATRIAIEAQGRPAPASLGPLKVIWLVAPPVVLLIGLLIEGALLYFALMVTGVAARFKAMMTVAVFVAPVVFYQGIVTSIVLRMRGLDTMQSVRDMQVSFGLDLLTSPDAHLGGFVRGVLTGINPFAIWGLVITALGVAVIEKAPSGKAWTAAIVAFLVGLLIQAALSSLGTTA